MAEVKLEAKQVVDEEQEKAPAKPRGKLMARKGLLIFGGIVIVEAVVLFFVFGLIRKPHAVEHAEATTQMQEGMTEHIAENGMIDVDEVSIFDDSDTTPGAFRRFTFSFTVVIAGDAWKKIVEIEKKNEQAQSFVKAELASEIRVFLLRHNGEQLKTAEMQSKIEARLCQHLNDEFTPLKGKIVRTHLKSFAPSRN
ncbi:MAG: hypothetical protein ACKVX7_13940 [Planctomycetota bacterium]